MSKKAKELKQQKRDAITSTLQAKMRANREKVHECLRVGDSAGASHYSSLNTQLRGLLKWKTFLKRY